MMKKTFVVLQITWLVAGSLALAGERPDPRNKPLLALPTATASVVPYGEIVSRPVKTPRGLAAEVQIERLPGSGATAGVLESTLVYENDDDESTSVYVPGVGDFMADDITLAVPGCDVQIYEILAGGFGSPGQPATFDAQLSLWDGDPCLETSSMIPDTDAVVTDIPNDGRVFFLTVDIGTPVAVPESLFLKVEFTNTDDAFWFIANEAEIGFTDAFFIEDDSDDTEPTCTEFVLLTSYEGFAASVFCNLDTAPTGACCVDDVCSVVSAEDCDSQSGVYRGNFTECEEGICVSGTCCRGAEFNVCSATSQAACDDGIFRANEVCGPEACGDIHVASANIFATGSFAPVQEPGGTWADQIFLGEGTGRDVVGIQMLFTGVVDASIGTAERSGGTLELWSNSAGDPEDPFDDVPSSPIPGTLRSFSDLVANGFNQTRFFTGFGGAQLPDVVWIVLSLDEPNFGPVLGGNNKVATNPDLVAIFDSDVAPGEWLNGFQFGDGFNPENCPSVAPCAPAASFRHTMYVEGDRPTGDCCDDTTSTTQSDIRSFECDGRFNPDPISNPTIPPCGTSACCSVIEIIPGMPQSVCQNQTEADCGQVGGNFIPGAVCPQMGPFCPAPDFVGFEGSCFEENDSPGCEDPFCTELVCNFDEFCCQAPWDSFCADRAVSFCSGARPDNDDWENATPIADTGTIPYGGSGATTDGPRHAECEVLRDFDTITKDVWFCWTAPCSDTAIFETCDVTNPDTSIAVYEGCEGPPSDANLLTCNDDTCGEQSLVSFFATEGQQYLIRAGVFPGKPGGPGELTISCGAPPNENCPGTGDCCDGAGTGTPACTDTTCCNRVCALDPFCCDVEWDEFCATNGFEDSGIGAAVLCPDLCGPTCADGPVEFIDPVDGTVDAGRPHVQGDPSALLGIDRIRVSAPAGSDNLDCWALCETASGDTPNSIVSVDDSGGGEFTINLARPITAGAVTTITHIASGTIGSFIAHPANVNGDSASGAPDIIVLIDVINGSTAPLFGNYSVDIDRGGAVGAPDITALIDLLNGASGFTPWNGVSKPVADGVCP